MISVDNFVNVQISLSNPTVSRLSLSTVLIFGRNLSFSDGSLYKIASKPSDLTDPKFGLSESGNQVDSNSEVYQSASSLCTEGLSKFLVGGPSSQQAAPQRSTVSFKGQVSSDPYTLKFEGDFVGEATFSLADNPTHEKILDGLMEAINSSDILKGSISTSKVNGEKLEITAKNHSHEFTIISEEFEVETSPRVLGSNTQDSLDQIKQQKDFYILLGLEQTKNEIVARSEWAEANVAFHVCTSNHDDNLTDPATSNSAQNEDVALELKKRDFKRTSFLYSANDQSIGSTRKNKTFADARWVASRVMDDPGSSSWAYASLSGIKTDDLSASHYNFLKAKNANCYISVAKRSIVADGRAANGNFIDTFIGLDWLKDTIQKDMFVFLADRKKNIPFNDQGIGLIALTLKDSLEKGKKYVLDEYTMNIPTLSSISEGKRKERVLEGLEWQGRLKGNIQTGSIKAIVKF